MGKQKTTTGKKKVGKFNRRIANQIIKLIREDDYTNEEICKAVHISRVTLWHWLSRFPEFKEEVDQAKDDLVQLRLKECKNSLTKLINGYTFDEETTEYIKGDNGKPVIRAQRVTQKHIAPNLGAIIHFQTNKDPENWVNKQRTEITGKNGEEFKLRPLTKEEIEYLLQNNG